MSTEQKLPITVCIPVKNEEKNLLHCLNSLSDSFEAVVVIDSSSTDQTKQIALDHGATYINFEWNGKYPKKRNWLLHNHPIQTPWVFFLDADERLTPEFIKEIRETIFETEHSGFWLAYDNWFMHRLLKHGDVFSKLALFRFGAGEYENFHEDFHSSLDIEIHEHPILNGSTGQINAKLEHHEYRGLEHYIRKHNDYSSWEAKRFLYLQNAGPEVWANFTPRQRFKYKNLDKWWMGLFYFLTTYFLKLGFLDGKVGWTFNSLKRRYFNEVRLKIQESRENLAAQRN